MKNKDFSSTRVALHTRLLTPKIVVFLIENRILKISVGCVTAGHESWPMTADRHYPFHECGFYYPDLQVLLLSQLFFPKSWDAFYEWQCDDSPLPLFFFI